MKIQIVSHTIPENVPKLIGRWSIVPFYFSRKKNKVDYILKNEWLSVLSRYWSFKPDIIITIGPVGAVIAFLKKIGIIKVPIVHDWNDNYAELMGEKWGTKFVTFLERYTIRHSDIIITPSVYRLEKAKKLGKRDGKTAFYVSHGAKDHFFKRYKKIKLPGKNAIKIVYVGQISRYKRVDELIKIVKDAQLDLILIGSNTLPENTLSSKNIFFLGEKKSEELPSFLVSADFLVVTEDNDSALKIMEYLALQKPILVPHGKIDYLSKLYPNITFYRSFQEIPVLVRQSRKKLFRKSKKIPSWEESVDYYLAILEKVVKKRKR